MKYLKVLLILMLMMVMPIGFYYEGEECEVRDSTVVLLSEVEYPYAMSKWREEVKDRIVRVDWEDGVEIFSLREKGGYMLDIGVVEYVYVYRGRFDGGVLRGECGDPVTKVLLLGRDFDNEVLEYAIGRVVVKRLSDGS